jgi:hypothetical protein
LFFVSVCEAVDDVVVVGPHMFSSVVVLLLKKEKKENLRKRKTEVFLELKISNRKKTSKKYQTKLPLYSI